jgi:hypothetical protein
VIENVDSGLAASGLLLRVSLYVVCLVLSGELCFDQPGAHAARFDPVLKFEFTTSINKSADYTFRCFLSFGGCTHNILRCVPPLRLWMTGYCGNILSSEDETTRLAKRSVGGQPSLHANTEILGIKGSTHFHVVVEVDINIARRNLFIHS